MKTKLVTLSDFKGHSHPASKLFRAIELRTIYKNTSKDVFGQPSMDLGGGDGYLSSILFDQKFTYNVDNGEANDLHIAKAHKRYRRILLESAEKMSLKSASLNFVFSNSVIEHIPDIHAVLSEVARVLKKGRAFVFTSPSNNFKEYLYLSNLIKPYGLSFLGDLYKEKRNKMLNHYHNYSAEEWTKLLNRYGLIVKKTDYYISQDTCMLWDRIALETRIRGLFDRNAEKNMYKKYKLKILNAIENDKVQKNKGASLFVFAVKK